MALWSSHFGFTAITLAKRRIGLHVFLLVWYLPTFITIATRIVRLIVWGTNEKFRVFIN